MTNDTWRPLGVETEAQVAEYDALHDGVPKWLAAPYWRWVREALTREALVPGRYGYDRFSTLKAELAEEMCQTLRIPLQDVSGSPDSEYDGHRLLDVAIAALSRHPLPLQIADYLLAHGGAGIDGAELESMLDRSKSAWRVGSRAERPGLERRVPLGVQVAADAVMTGSGNAGVRLAKAWEELYGPNPDASQAYRLAIQAVEDAAVPVVSPTNGRATLGTVLGQLESQGDWQLPMTREHTNAPSREVIISMARMLWHGQHDRHGGQPSAPGNVSAEEATVAVSLAVTLVQWFSSGLVARAATP